MFEKVGEATEVALKVLVEKLNVQGLDRSRLSNKLRSCACCNVINGEFNKVKLKWKYLFNYSVVI